MFEVEAVPPAVDKRQGPPSAPKARNLAAPSELQDGRAGEAKDLKAQAEQLKSSEPPRAEAEVPRVVPRAKAQRGWLGWLVRGSVLA